MPNKTRLHHEATTSPFTVSIPFHSPSRALRVSGQDEVSELQELGARSPAGDEAVHGTIDHGHIH